MVHLYGGIDAGGTTFKCGIKDNHGNWVAKQRVPVSDPDTTIGKCVDFFAEAVGDSSLRGMGIASFGPIDVDPQSPDYGTIFKTPKPGWSGIQLRGRFEEKLGLRVAIDTDVNGALLAEMDSGSANGVSSAIYITIGTGIGAGIAINGQLIGKPSHPEFGHICVKRHADDTDFRGSCPFHSDCLEGLTSVTALKQRWGDPVNWPDHHMGWDISAFYLGQAASNLILTLRPDRIILGGGLMLSPNMLDRVRQAVNRIIGDYINPRVSEILVRPEHGDDAGLEGALYLAVNNTWR